MKNLKPILCLILFAFIISGCQSSNANQTKVEPKQDPGRIIVMAIDDTGSYRLWNQAKNITAQIINQTKPGDVFYLRKITGESYTDKSTLFRLELPKMPASSYENPFDRKAKKHKKLFEYRTKALKQKAIKMVAKLQTSSAGHTDILSFLAIASEKFQLADKNAKRIICIASDLQENVRYKPDLNLSGAKIAIVGFQPMKDPKRTQRFKQKWINIFKKAGTTHTIFIRADERFNLNIL